MAAILDFLIEISGFRISVMIFPSVMTSKTWLHFKKNTADENPASEKDNRHRNWTTESYSPEATAKTESVKLTKRKPCAAAKQAVVSLAQNCYVLRAFEDSTQRCQEGS